MILDKRYINIVGARLERFERRGDDVYNFRCPFCGDSKKSQTKRRGYIFPNEKRTGFVYKCHNCGISMSFPNFLKEMFADVYEDYRKEQIEERLFENEAVGNENKDGAEVKKPDPKIDAFSIAKTAKNMPKEAIEYLRGRKVREEDIERYAIYVHDGGMFLRRIFPDKEKYKKLVANHPYVGIMCIDANDKLSGIVFRSLNKYSLPRYLSVRISDRYFFGLDRINDSNVIFVFEGVFDALMVHNGVAALTSSLNRVERYIEGIDRKRIVYVHDNEIGKNEEIEKIIMQNIDSGREVVIFPEHINGKDLNEMVVNGEISLHDIEEFLLEHAYSGLRAKAKFYERKYH